MSIPESTEDVALQTHSEAPAGQFNNRFNEDEESIKSSSFSASNQSLSLEPRVEPDPITLTVEALLSDSVDSFAWRLSTLQNSQLVLETQLDELQQRLESYREVTEPVAVAETVAQISVVKKRLTTINHALQKIEKRLQKSLGVLGEH